MRESLSSRLARDSTSTFQGLMIICRHLFSERGTLPFFIFCADHRGIEFALEKMKKKEVAQVKHSQHPPLSDFFTLKEIFFCLIGVVLNPDSSQITLTPAYGFGSAGCSQLVRFPVSVGVS